MAFQITKPMKGETMSQKSQAIAAFLLAQDRARAMFAEAVEGMDKLAERLQEVAQERDTLKAELEAERAKSATAQDAHNEQPENI